MCFGTDIFIGSAVPVETFELNDNRIILIDVACPEMNEIFSIPAFTIFIAVSTANKFKPVFMRS